MKKTILTIIALGSIANASYFNNSVDRWEFDCKSGIIYACGIAGNMYIKGKWEDANTGKMIKIKKTKKERIKKAKELLARGCMKGHKKSCTDLKALTK